MIKIVFVVNRDMQTCRHAVMQVLKSVFVVNRDMQTFAAHSLFKVDLKRSGAL